MNSIYTLSISFVCLFWVSLRVFFDSRKDNTLGGSIGLALGIISIPWIFVPLYFCRKPFRVLLCSYSVFLPALVIFPLLKPMYVPAIWMALISVLIAAFPFPALIVVFLMMI